jgi:formylglycine-generating enzyme required for sulfatase activity
VQHKVTLTKPFGLGQFDVTVGEFRAFVTATGFVTEAEKGGTLGLLGAGMFVFDGKKWAYLAGTSWRTWGSQQDDQRPVIGVTWDDAKAFCAWVNKTQSEAGRLPAGYEYTLPTEAQWEYACRAGTTGAYSGDLDGLGWYAANSGNTIHPVGQKQANSWGLYDMHGNVWEWCADWIGEYPSGSVTDPAGPASGLSRANRGGSWFSSPRYCRSANRGWARPGARGTTFGFRLALAPKVIQ